MPQEKLTAPPSQHLARSKEGLWVKAERDAKGVHVFWQVRTTVVGGCLVEYDANGDESRRRPMQGIEYPDPWKLAGTVEPSAEIVEVAGLQDFDWFQFGLMRHAAELIALGYGDDPEEVLTWFEDVTKGEWIREGEYRIAGPERKPFTGLKPARLYLDDRLGVEDPVLSGTVLVGDTDEFPFEFPLEEALAAFTISAVPV